MRVFRCASIVGVFFQVGAVGVAVAEENVHDRAGERAVGARPDDDAQIGLLHRRIVVDVDDDDLGAALFPGAHRVRHDVDLGDDGVRTPDHHAIRLRHLARIGPREPAGAHDVAGPGEIGADRVEEAGVLLGVAQPVDGIALHEAHRAGIVVGPDRFRSVPFLRRDHLLGDEVERGLPTRLLPDALALRPGAHQRFRQAVGMVDALGVAGDLGADDAGRVAVVAGAVDAADAAVAEQLDVERAGRRAVVGTGRMADFQGGVLVHRAKLAILCRCV